VGILKQFYRIIDANINRASEGLRVLEDLTRFYWEKSDLTEELKLLRHNVRKNLVKLTGLLLTERDALHDVGLNISQKHDLDNKKSLQDLVLSNFKRVQEGLRVVEETLKAAGFYEKSKSYENLRFSAYTLETKYFKQLGLLPKGEVINSDLYCLTSEEHSLGRSNLQVVTAMLEAGVKIIQYREKEKQKLAKYQECLEIRKLTKAQGVTFIVNDDVDLAILVKADGVHIGQDDLPIEEVRKLVGPEMLIGLSTHSPEQAQAAIRRGADYIGVGPIYRTFTKKDVCEPVGLEYLDYAVNNVPIPFVAIGGIKEHNVAEVVKRGARCVAMVTDIVGSRDVREKISTIQGIINMAK
jgi:thiamine-phosphate pyrophosphorylase